MAKTLKQVLELYKPKAGDEQRFAAKHVVVKIDDVNGNKDDVFQATNVKAANRNKDNHGYPPGADEEVYEEVEQVDEEQLNELSSDTLRRYMWKARKAINKDTAHLGDAPAGSKRLSRINKRVKGFRTAWAKADTKESVELDDKAKLLELYANLNDENRANLIEMFDQDKDLLMSFVNGSVESEEDNV